MGDKKVSAALVKDAASEIMGDLGDSGGSNKLILGLLVLIFSGGVESKRTLDQRK